ncbi:hypothetical protein IOD13_03585 [Brevibacterium casei]|nr:hypothetical protein [Brevibacterium casei]
MKRTVGIAALVVALPLGGRGIGGEDQASPAPEATTASATEAPPAAGTPTAAEGRAPRALRHRSCTPGGSECLPGDAGDGLR